MNKAIKDSIAYYFTTNCAYEYIERERDVLVFIELGDQSYTCVWDRNGSLRGVI